MSKLYALAGLITFTFVSCEKLSQSEPVKETNSENQVALHTQLVDSDSLTDDDIDYLVDFIAKNCYYKIPPLYHTSSNYGQVYDVLTAHNSFDLRNKMASIRTLIDSSTIITEPNNFLEYISFHSRQIFLGKKTCTPFLSASVTREQVFNKLFKIIKEIQYHSYIKGHISYALKYIKFYSEIYYNFHRIAIDLDSNFDPRLKIFVKENLLKNPDTNEYDLINQHTLVSLKNDAQSLYDELKNRITIANEILHTALAEMIFFCKLQREADEVVRTRTIEIYEENRYKQQPQPYVLYGVILAATLAFLSSMLYTVSLASDWWRERYTLNIIFRGK